MASITRFGSATLSKIVFCLIACLGTTSAQADWTIYTAADVGISTAVADTDGVFVGGTVTANLKGSDTDSSPLVGGAIGLAVPMSEILPREWVLDVRLPDWPVRFEVEGAGLREYEFRTVGSPGNKFFTESKVATFFVNSWLDIPLNSVWRPVQYLFGLGRQPRVRGWLEPMSFYLGTGVGFSWLDFKGRDNVLRASDDFLDFAWNAGAGINYELTDRVSLGAGYRYVGVGKQSLDVDGPVASTRDDLDIEQDIHEFRATIRVSVYDFLSPWR